MIEFKADSNANYNPFIVTYYCYKDDCPPRTEKEPYPRSDGEYRYVKITSKKGNIYRAKKVVCKHCGNIMRGTVSMDVFE